MLEGRPVLTRRPVGAPPGRRAHGKAREQAILDAAADLFSETGLDATTRDLAGRLGITQPLLYRYFDSKERLIKRVLDIAFPADWDTVWARLRGPRDAPLRQRLTAFFLAYSSQVLTARRMRLLMYSGLRRVGRGPEVLQALRARAVDHVLEELGRDAPPSGPAEPLRQRSLACALHDAVFAFAVRRHILAAPGTEDVQDAIADQVDRFLEAAAHAPDTAAPARLPETLLPEALLPEPADAEAEPAGIGAGLVAECLSTGGPVWATPPAPAAAASTPAGEKRPGDTAADA